MYDFSLLSFSLIQLIARSSLNLNMLFKPALFLAALVTLAAARPNPSSLKTIASATGSKSSIKSPSQKLAEKNSSPSATIVEIPVQGVQGISQTETLSATLQAQDSLQYSHNPVPTVVEEKPVVEHQPIAVAAASIVPETVHTPVIKETIVKESEVVAPSVIQNEVVKPASYSNSDAVATIVHTPVVAPAVVPAAPIVTPVVTPIAETPVVVEHKPAVVEPVVAEQPTPIVEHKPVVVETPVVSEKVVPVEKPVVEQAAPVVEHPVVANEKPVEHVAPVVVVSLLRFNNRPLKTIKINLSLFALGERTASGCQRGCCTDCCRRDRQ